MKIYTLSIVKNEADVISYTIKRALEYADKVIFFDTGSADNTAKLIEDFPDPRVVLFKSEKRVYSDGLRGEIFNHYKHELKKGDWWVIQDSDEFFVDNPRDFIHKIKGNYHYVASKKVDYRITKEDLEESLISGDFEKDIKNIKYHNTYAWSEIRLLKYREGLEWPKNAIWPKNMGLVYRKPIKIKHYPYRSVEQMKMRYNTRVTAKNENPEFFLHMKETSWEDYLCSREEVLQEHTGEDFSSVALKNSFQQKWYVILIKKVLHGIGIWK